MKAEDSTPTEAVQPGAAPSNSARRRAAVELVAHHGASLRQTARRYSLNAEDAEDAYQRALEILLTKAPTCEPRELIRWTHTVTKHEALAVRRKRERLLGNGPPRRPADGSQEDWLDLIPSRGAGPAERVERRELIARSREALQALKPAELRALTLLAEGYSYAEISEITGFSATKVNRCLAEGRERFRRLVSGSEDGSRCAEMRPLLSAVCDGEATAEQERTVREHLRACPGCRATMRSYRAAAPAAAALALPPSRSLLERLGDLVAEAQARLPGTGRGADPEVAQVAATGGAKGAGLAGMAKLLAVCGAGGAAACVAAGVAPPPLEMPVETRSPSIQRVLPKPPEAAAPTLAPEEPSEPAPSPPRPAPERPEPEPPPVAEASEPEPAEAGAIEYAPPPEPEPEAAAAPVPPDPGGAAGEFGP